MLNSASEAFFIQEITLKNSHLLPEDRKSIVYFVTAMQGENKKNYLCWIHGKSQEQIRDSQEKSDFEFLDRMGYQINISWIVLPDGTGHKEQDVVQRCYIRAFKPKLNCNQNTIATLQAEEARRQDENWEQCQYGYLDKQIENWQQSGDDQDTLIKKIWEAGKERFLVNI